MKLKFIICGIAAIAATGFQASADVLTDAFEAVKSIGGAMIVDTPEQQLQEKGIDAATWPYSRRPQPHLKRQPTASATQYRPSIP